MPENYPSPCEGCDLPSCRGQRCNSWLMRYRHRQKLINGYAHKVLQPHYIRRESFVYSHPDDVRRWLLHGPCPGCKLNETCDTPCAAYLTWYNDRMALARKKAEQ